MKSLLLAVCMVLALGLPAPQAQAQDEPTIIFNVTTDDVWTGQMALGLAKRMLDAGHDVVVFLNVRAVTLANSAVPPHTAAGPGLTAHEMIAGLLDAGGRVFVCPTCTVQAGLSADNWIEGVEAGSPELIDLMMAPGTRIISY